MSVTPTVHFKFTMGVGQRFSPNTVVELHPGSQCPNTVEVIDPGSQCPNITEVIDPGSQCPLHSDGWTRLSLATAALDSLSGEDGRQYICRNTTMSGRMPAERHH